MSNGAIAALVAMFKMCAHVSRGWLGWGGQKQPKQQDSKSKMVDDALYRSSDLPMEMSIPDNTRCILSVTVSPLGDLAALVDSFGRVMLLDCDSMAVRRMWKGTCCSAENFGGLSNFCMLKIATIMRINS